MVKNVILVVAILLSLLLFGMWRIARSDQVRLQWNQGVMMDSLISYKIRDSLNAASVGVLKLELSEMKEYRAQDVQLIKDLGVRLRRAQSVSKVSTEFRYEIEDIPLIGIDKWSCKTQYLDITASLIRDSLVGERMSASVVVYDTLVQVLHRVPRFKFLGICFGTKGVKQEVVSKNPYTKIVAAEYLEIVK